MSQMVTRKSATTDEKEKSRDDIPLQDMKKKVAANAEKEKLAAEKQNGEKKDKVSEKSTSDKSAEKKTAEKKVSEKPTSDKAAEKKTADKNSDKVVEKKTADKSMDKVAEKKTADKSMDKAAEKKTADKSMDKAAEKKTADKSMDKAAEKKTAEKQKSVKAPEKINKEKQIGDKATDKDTKGTEKPIEKKAEEIQKEGSSKGEKTGKPEPKETPKKTDKEADFFGFPTQNGNKPHNGVSDVTLSSNGGSEEVLNGSTVSEDSDDESMSGIDDHENDDIFPELSYEDDSDEECFQTPTPESLNRSLTRRSQVKATRTPETPRPASDKNTRSDGSDKDDKQDNTEETKVLKLNEDPSTTARKLRSTDSPKKTTEKPQDSPKVIDSPKIAEEPETPQTVDKEKMLDMVIDVEDCESTPEGKARKTDTNFSKSRVKVSPYRRSTRLADQTTSSILANYTGNNTTMEMDITECSIVEDSSVAEEPSSFINPIRHIRGRKSYKNLKELDLNNLSIERIKRRAAAQLAESELPRPTKVVVGRKRKPEAEEAEPTEEAEPAEEAELAEEVTEPVDLTSVHAVPTAAYAKRMRLLDKFMSPFRKVASSTPLPQRRAAPIVGINTDLPMSVLVPLADSIHSETVKNLPAATTSAPLATVPAPNVPVANDRNSNKCVVMWSL